jgi:copper chaperone CopZ
MKADLKIKSYSCPHCNKDIETTSKLVESAPSTDVQQLKAEIAALVSKFDPDHKEHYTYHLKDLLRDLRQLSAV